VGAAFRGSGARFSLTVRMNPHLAAAITQIPDQAWTPIRYPEAFVDPDTGELVSDAEVAETAYTAFTGRTKAEQATARLIVRRVRRLGPQAAGGQGELFSAWRYHPVFTDSPFTMLQAELHHRQHAVIEQIIANGKSGPLAHLPSGSFQANNAWLTLWRSRSTSCGPQAASPAPTTPERQPPPCAPTRSTSPHALPVQPVESHSTYPTAGPGSTHSPACSTPPMHHQPEHRPDQHAPRARPEQTWKSWADQQTPHALKPATPGKPSKRSPSSQPGGFGLNARPF
jgi:hypothetical protein